MLRAAARPTNRGRRLIQDLLLEFGDIMLLLLVLFQGIPWSQRRANASMTARLHFCHLREGDEDTALCLHRSRRQSQQGRICLLDEACGVSAHGSVRGFAAIRNSPETGLEELWKDSRQLRSYPPVGDKSRLNAL